MYSVSVLRELVLRRPSDDTMSYKRPRSYFLLLMPLATTEDQECKWSHGASLKAQIHALLRISHDDGFASRMLDLVPFCQHSALCFSKASDRSLSPGQSLCGPATQCTLDWGGDPASQRPPFTSGCLLRPDYGSPVALRPPRATLFLKHLFPQTTFLQKPKMTLFLPRRLSLEFKAFLYLTVTSIQWGHLPSPSQWRAWRHGQSPSLRHHPSFPESTPPRSADDPAFSVGFTSTFCSPHLHKGVFTSSPSHSLTLPRISAIALMSFTKVCRKVPQCKLLWSGDFCVF